MDHKIAVQEQLAERYLLNELSDTEREQFEEHYFDCQACAEDVRQSGQFVAGARVVLREQEATVPSAERSRKWFQWFWNPMPAYALAAALALTVLVQNSQDSGHLQPQLISSVELRPATRGAPQTLRVAPGQSTAQISVAVPDGAAYTCTLFKGDEQIGTPIQTPVLESPEISLLLPAEQFRDGRFKLVVQAQSGTGAPFHEEFEFISQP